SPLHIPWVTNPVVNHDDEIPTLSTKHPTPSSAHASVAQNHSRVRLFDAGALPVFPSVFQAAFHGFTIRTRPKIRRLLVASHTICLPFPEEMVLRQQSRRRLSFRNRQSTNPHPKRIVCTEKRTQKLSKTKHF
ncbi:unnamed protein product, partial [Ectocarpus sp. 6 AP-2014]